MDVAALRRNLASRDFSTLEIAEMEMAVVRADVPANVKAELRAVVAAKRPQVNTDAHAEDARACRIGP